MKLAELRASDGRALRLHPRLAVIEADEETRASLLTALESSMRAGGAAAGYVEVHGVLLDLDRDTFRLLDLDPAAALVLRASDIPVDAYGPGGRRHPEAEELPSNKAELVDARRRQVQEALDVVNWVQAALRAASGQRDQAAQAFADAHSQLADAIASREAAHRAVDSLADAAEEADEDDLGDGLEALGEPPVEATIVEAERVDDAALDIDLWADQRIERLEAVQAAERRVVEARTEVEQSARAANPARLDQHDRDELEAAHEATLDADDRANRRMSGAAARKRLDAARAAERLVLDRLGLDSYSDFLLRASMGSTDPSAELRLEIARTELMEAEAALSAAHAASEAVPPPPPPRPAHVAAPELPAAPVASVASIAPTPTAPVAEPLGEGAARLAAASRAHDDALAAEQRAHAGHNEAAAALADAEAKLLELSVRYDEAEQSLAQARVRVDAALADLATSNGHPSDPGWAGVGGASAVSNEIDRHLLAWLAARGQHPLADPLPIVLDEAYRHVGGEDLDALLLRLDHLADSLHVVYMTDDPKVLQWVASMPPERAGLAVLPAAGRATPA